ncbi:MAG: catalase family protein [Burkholderiales bacterium]
MGTPLTRHEQAPAGEDAAIAEILGIIKAKLREQFPAGQGDMRRDAHPKHHGAVRAELAVEPNLPPELAVGVFRAPRSYPAWVRFSNGSGTVQPDHLRDGRGIAIKLMDVDGTKLMADESRTQDFLFINHDVFAVKDARDYVELFRVIERDGAPTKFFLGLNPFKWHLKELANANRIRVQISNLLTLQYWTMTPYLMGDMPAKFSMRPQVPANTGAPPNSAPDYLREVMAQQLRRESVAFDFMVQLQSDPHRMPVEDPRVRWEPAESPWRKVATLRIPMQTFDSPAQLRFAEDLSYSPWHSVAEHQPLGGVNRCRRIVYHAISELRHGANGRSAFEPNGTEQF